MLKTVNVGSRLKELYRHHKTDAYIISFPKCGRTWLRVLIGKTLCETFSIPGEIMLDTYKVTSAAGILRTQVTHDHSSITGGCEYYRLPTNKGKYSKKKVIFLFRDIKDVIVSCYFQASKRVNKYTGSISDFIRSEQYGVQKIITFYNIWYENRVVPKEFLLIRYEDMHKNTQKVLTHTMNFLGLNEVDDYVVKNAVDFANFNKMKKMEKKGIFKNDIIKPRNINDDDSYKVRKGVVGGYNSFLSEEDIKYVDKVIKEMGCPLDKYSTRYNI